MATVIAAAMGGVYALTAEAAVTCAPSVFKRQMFANTSFSGTPLTTDCDSAIDQDWGTDAPAPGLPDDRFGVRWSVTRDFGSGGPFTLTVSGRGGGVRVYLDGHLRSDLRGDAPTPFATPGGSAGASPLATAVPATVPVPVPVSVPVSVSESVDVTVPPGRHTLRVDYVHRRGAAEVAFTAVPLSLAGTVTPPSPR
ncbi:PA14 domain-containing protein [Streptomyces sp. HM190]|uniref:PA14 domain-containing protein n=1 Tax=Streptomyces sp. HM190 TaxID=2695266 RepID=UPI002E2DDD43|nr:PA14 domain-containing protein [Streptomyces sp. HM190]